MAKRAQTLVRQENGVQGEPSPDVVADAEEQSFADTDELLLALAAGANAFEAYLASLLHNVSHVVALRVLDRHPPSTPLPASAAFCAAFIARTRDLALAIGERWRFPPPVVRAAVDADPATPLASLVAASDRLSKLRLLCEAGWIDEDRALRALDGSDVLAGSFAQLGVVPREA